MISLDEDIQTPDVAFVIFKSRSRTGLCITKAKERCSELLRRSIQI
jgi:hypothetical protein